MMQKQATGQIVKPASKPAVVVKNVTKEFIIPHERKTTLFENIKGIFQPSTYERFTAVKDVSFTVERGDSIGIIGDNGSGKSTLLKLIANIIRPSRGTIEINGKITPFLELGVGFQPDMTARENIDIYGTMMGLSDKEIWKNMDSVLEFAGLTKFADTKLKNFSSGMQVRLAFATAIQKEPDILLVDEVLAVGDIDFQRKCFDVFRKYKEANITILFVSHDLSSIRRFCDKTLLLNRGRVVAFEDTNDVIDKYVYKIDTARAPEDMGGIEKEKPLSMGTIRDTDIDSLEYVAKHRAIPDMRWGNKKLEIANVRLIDKNGNEGDSYMSGDPMTIKMEYKLNAAIERPIFGFDISDEKGVNCFGTNSLLKGKHVERPKRDGMITIHLDEIPFLQGKYYLSVAAQSEDCSITYDWHNKKYPFYVLNNGNEEGFVRFKCDFEIDQGE